MADIILIRHSLTKGNLLKRYVGVTDEPLCEEGIQLLRQIKYPDADMVYTSPLKRCVQTAGIIYPEKELIICNDLRECDFGDFENKNYLELAGNPDYQKWIDSGGNDSFPNGEDVAAFKKRCTRAFKEIVLNNNGHDIAVIAHGGTIMSIMEEFTYPKREYYLWNIDNAKGYLVNFDQENWRISVKCIIH